ncbi:MAG TPA: zinc finger domain-containing protein, partial [Nitrospiria bacterium]
ENTARLIPLFIVSDVELARFENSPPAEMDRVSTALVSFGVSVLRTTHPKCERCRNYRNDIGGGSGHPPLCARCTEAVG